MLNKVDGVEVMLVLVFAMCKNFHLFPLNPVVSYYMAHTHTQSQSYLKHVFVQQSRSKHGDAVCADAGVKTSEQLQGVQFDTVQVESH